MNQRFLMWGLAGIAFIATLAISSWNEGLWPFEETTIPHGNHQATVAMSTEPAPLPARPFGPETLTEAPTPPPTVDSAVPLPPDDPPPIEAPEPPPVLASDEDQPPSVPAAETEQEMTEFLANRDRASQRSSRAR